MKLTLVTLSAILALSEANPLVRTSRRQLPSLNLPGTATNLTGAAAPSGAPLSLPLPPTGGSSPLTGGAAPPAAGSSSPLSSLPAVGGLTGAPAAPAGNGASGSGLAGLGGLGGLAGLAGALGGQQAPYPGNICSGLTGTPQCCATDVLGLADLDCATPPSRAKDAKDFNKICGDLGQRARCCAIPILNQAVICAAPT